jgi:hypothetical protein
MSATQWVVEGDDDNPVYELQGRKFGSGDDGAPMLCNLVCSAQGRHAHIDYCRDPDPDNCNDPESEHIVERMNPDPDEPKDWISHGTFWARSGRFCHLPLRQIISNAGILGFKGMRGEMRCRGALINVVIDPYSQDEQVEFGKW